MLEKSVGLFDVSKKAEEPQSALSRSSKSCFLSTKLFGPSWPEAMSYRSPRSITGRDQNGPLFDLGNVPIFAEILNFLNKGSGEDSLDFLGFLTLPPTTSRL